MEMDRPDGKQDWPTIVIAQGTSISNAPRHYVVQLNYRKPKGSPPYTISPRPFNIPTQTNYQLYPQLSESTGTFEELRFSFPNPNTRPWKEALSASYKHFFPDHSEDTIQRFIEF